MEVTSAIAPPAAGTTRGQRRRQGAANGVVVAYLAGAGVALLAGDRVARSSWLALHLLLLGAVTNAIVTWSEYFSAALLHARPVPRAYAAVRLLGLNLAVLAVLAGVVQARPGLVAAGAALLEVVVAGHLLGLAAMARRGLGRRFQVTVAYYAAGGLALAVGVGLGALLATGAAVDHQAVRLAHAHLNLLGWVGLAVLGTQVTLWPTMLHTRIDEGAETAARRALLLAVVGLAAVVAGLLAGLRAVTVLGLALYAAGLLVTAGPFVRTLARAHQREAPGWMVGCGLGWLVAAVLADLVATATLAQPADAGAVLVPAVAVGFAAQTLTGALTYLLPVVGGGGPHGSRRLARLLSTAWVPRTAAVNLGTGLVVVPGLASWPMVLGWALVGAGLGLFVVLAAVTLARSGKPTGTSHAEAADGTG
jgi:nitrite reductase (NO-forming)